MMRLCVRTLYDWGSESYVLTTKTNKIELRKLALHISKRCYTHTCRHGDGPMDVGLRNTDNNLDLSNQAARHARLGPLGMA